jgi:hypothetical protein
MAEKEVTTLELKVSVEQKVKRSIRNSGLG